MVMHSPLLKSYSFFALIQMVGCCGFVWQGFGSEGAIWVASVRSCEKPPTNLTEPVPAVSEMDPPLAKAKPVSEGGSTSVITYLRREKKSFL